MLPDTAALQKEVKADIAKVREAYQGALESAENTPASGAIVGLSAKIDDWAKRGTEAAARPGGSPSLNGWPGWTNAGTLLLSGLPSMAKEGKQATLKAITATIKDSPAETIRTLEASAKKVADGVHSAEHAIVSVGAGVTGLAKTAMLYGVGALVLIAVLRRVV